MKKLLLALIVSTIVFPSMAQKTKSVLESKASVPEIKLPAPTTTGGMPLYEALSKRKTNRVFSDVMISEQMLSDILWCAGGVNRPDGKLTSPTARNAQEIDIYVFLPNGVYLYIPKENMLKLVLPDDHRPEISSKSDMPAVAPVTLLFVANYDKMQSFSEEAREFYGATDAGFVSQNVYLYCAANKLNTVVMGAIDRDNLRGFLELNGKAILAQPIGYNK